MSQDTLTKYGFRLSETTQGLSKLLKSDSAVQVENVLVFLSIPYIDALPLGYLTLSRGSWNRTNNYACKRLIRDR